MKGFRLIPIWLWIVITITIVLLCSSCRGGRSLGNGSAGTVIIPQTPKQINERNRPDFAPLPPVPIIPPRPTPQLTTNAVRSTPTTPKQSSAKADPVVVDPKPAGKATSFTPTVNNNTPPVDVKTKTPPTKLIEGDGGCVIITPNPKNPPIDDKIITPTPTDNKATIEAESFNWWELLSNYLLFLFIAIFIWAIYDIIKISRKKEQPKTAKRKRSPSKKKVKRKGSKKKLEKYKKTIPKGSFLKNNEKPKQ